MQFCARQLAPSAASQHTACVQESQVGADKIAVAQILKDHSVLVRGGQEQGAKLMEALVVGSLPPVNNNYPLHTLLSGVLFTFA